MLAYPTVYCTWGLASRAGMKNREGKSTLPKGVVPLRVRPSTNGERMNEYRILQTQNMLAYPTVHCTWGLTSLAGMENGERKSTLPKGVVPLRVRPSTNRERMNEYRILQTQNMLAYPTVYCTWGLTSRAGMKNREGKSTLPKGVVPLSATANIIQRCIALRVRSATTERKIKRGNH